MPRLTVGGTKCLFLLEDQVLGEADCLMPTPAANDDARAPLRAVVCLRICVPVRAGVRREGREGNDVMAGPGMVLDFWTGDTG